MREKTIGTYGDNEKMHSNRRKSVKRKPKGGKEHRFISYEMEGTESRCAYRTGLRREMNEHTTWLLYAYRRIAVTRTLPLLSNRTDADSPKQREGGIIEGRQLQSDNQLG